MPSLEGRRIALVGGAGFIGHHLARELKARGADPHVIDGLEVNNHVAYASLPPGTENRELYLKILHQRLDLLGAAEVPLHRLDACDYNALSRSLSEIEAEVVVHLAAVAHAGRS